MKTSHVLEELLSYSQTLPLETKGWSGAVFDGYVGIGLIGVGIAFIFLFFMELPSGGGSGSGIVGICFILFGTVGMILVVGDMLTKESSTLYDLEERKWEREMATPFLETIPATRITDIQTISYNYEMEADAENWLFQSTIHRKEDAIPVTVVTENRESYEVWATIEPLQKNMSESTLELKELEKDLIFHERSRVFQAKGYFDTVLYTDEKI